MRTSILIIFAMAATICVEGTIEKCEKKIDLAIVLDSSASVSEENFNLAKQFSKELSRRFSLHKDKTRVSLVTFSQYINIKTRFKDSYDQKAIDERLDNTSYEASSTGTAKALEAVNFEVFSEKTGARRKRNDVKEAAIVVTDGYSYTGSEDVQYQTELMKNAGIEVYTVGVSKQMNQRELEAMASKPTNMHFFKLTDQENGKAIADQISKEICK